MKNKRNRYLFLLVFALWMVFGSSPMTAFAAVTEGTPGQTLCGAYAVIVNTNVSQVQKTGTLIFESDTEYQSASAQSSREAASLQPDVAAASDVRQVSASGISVSYFPDEEKEISSPYGSSTYVCIGEGAHCYVWMEKALKAAYDAENVTEVIARDISSVYDGTPYETLSAMCGNRMPYRDGSGKLSILLEEITGGASGVYKNDYGITAIHIDVPEASGYRAGEMISRNGLLVHEGQHALFGQLTQYDANQPYLWLNEGLSVAAMDYVWGGTDNSGWLDRIDGSAEIRNGSSLFYRTYRGNTAQDYAMPYLFVRYLIDRKAGGYRPMAVFPQFYGQSAAVSPAGWLCSVMGDGTSFADLLTEFYTAVVALEPQGKYGFSGDSIAAEKAGKYPLFAGESGQSYSLDPTAAIVIGLENGSFTVPEDGGADIRYMVVGSRSTPAVPAAGKGTAADPYLISSFGELNLMGNEPGAYYRLTQNISSDGELNLTVTNFRGVLDGGGYTVKGLRCPLVGTNSGVIRNLTVEASMRGEAADLSGVFCLRNSGKIMDCRAKGSVSIRLGAGSGYGVVYGTFAAENTPAGVIKSCSTEMAVHLILPAQRCRAGGITGVQSGTVENCRSAGTVSVVSPYGNYEVAVGGIVGELHPMGVGGAVINCVHLGGITAQGGDQKLGQLCGTATDSAAGNLKAYLQGCYGKAGNIPAVGMTGTNVSDDDTLLNEDSLKNTDSYSNWSFGSDWKITEDGPALMEPDDIETIEVQGADSLTCYVGEKPFYWGTLCINGQASVRITEDMISGFDSSTEGIKTVTVLYKNRTASISVRVTEPTEITKLEISSVRHCTYTEGERFNPDGVCLLATIDGKLRYIYSGFRYTPNRPLLPSDTSVTFSYYGAKVSCGISVSGIVPASVSVISKMERTLYPEGNRLDLSGAKIQITYSNGTKSPVLSSDQFEAYGIHAAKYTESGGYEGIAFDEALTYSDRGAVICLWAGDVQPGNYGAVQAAVGTVDVTKRLQASDETLYMTVNISDQFVNTKQVSGGSGVYRTAVVAEHLPTGVKRTAMPSGGGYTYFVYQGRPEESGTYTCIYDITDDGTGEKTRVRISIEVCLPNTARMFQFNLYAAQNPGLSADIIGVIGENTIILTVPCGTDVTALVPNIDYGAGMGVTVPPKFYNGTKHDFSSPVLYELTAPDGKTKKIYTVYVEIRGQSGGSTENAGGSTGSTGGSTGSTGGSAGSTGGSTGSTVGSAGSTGGSTGSTGNAGGSTGSTGGSTGNTGGSTGNTGGSTGSTGGSTGSTVGSAGSTGGSTGSTGNTGVGQAKFVLPKTAVRNGYKITIANTVLEYSGKSLKPAVTVKYGGRKIKEKYYTVKYSSNKKTGLAGAVIRGKGTYAKKIPETKLHFVIVPRRMTITSVKNSKNGTAAVGWKTDGLAGGYQLQICRNSKFKEGVTSYEIKKTKKGRTITGLKKKKTYYFRIRPYIKVKNTLFYGRWSKVRSIKIKK